MNTSIKTKVNRLGLVGMIISILLIVSVIIFFVSWVGVLSPHFQLFMESAWEEFIFILVDRVAAIVVYAFLFRVANGFRCCESPFDDEVIHRMSVFAWIILGYSLLSRLLNNVPNIITELQYNPTASSVLESLRILILPSFPLAVSLIVLALTKIFRYGAQLQKESDETL